MRLKRLAKGAAKTALSIIAAVTVAAVAVCASEVTRCRR